MAILNFPDTTGKPTDGSFTYEENGVLYTWDGEKWTASSSANQDDLLFVDGRNASEATQEFKDGIEVTGGSLADVGNGIYYNNTKNSLTIAANDQNFATFGLKDEVANCQLGSETSLSKTLPGIYNFQAIYKGTGHGNQHFLNVQSTVTADTGITDRISLYAADAAPQTNGSLYGYRANLNSNTAPDVFAFYSEGTAPNYFAGEIRTSNYFATGPGGGLTFGSRNKNISGSGGMQVYAEGNSAVPTGQIQLISNGPITANGRPISTTFLVDSTESESDISNASNVIKLLQPKILSGGSNARFGFNLPSVIANASEAVQTYTHVLTEPDDENPVTEERTAIDQTKLIPLLTKALQEALARIEELESNTLQPLYSTLADLPDASEHHGKTAHVHSEGALYFAHAGNWVKLQNA